MGFPGYFLIVWDFIRAAREMGVIGGTGPWLGCRLSVVAYCLTITNIDPMKYDLLFERFLNPDRISLPDVDVDFDEDGRADVLRYCVAEVRPASASPRSSRSAPWRPRCRHQGRRPRTEAAPLGEQPPSRNWYPKGPGTACAKAYKEVPELVKERSRTIR